MNDLPLRETSVLFPAQQDTPPRPAQGTEDASSPLGVGEWERVLGGFNDVPVAELVSFVGAFCAQVE
ncbi:hypothetical protein ACFWTE_29810, partial [Nocardiopsis sp. NPDC058631]|uniref:hypothetical protein n=1 Tax=Nocardiopsis sp. NPDC058631 TaxID=3346566 RepID=UPI00365DFCDE